MSYCAVLGCTCGSKNPFIHSMKKVSFHRFPDRKKDWRLYCLWLLKINRKGYRPSIYSSVCSEHFDDTDFEYSSSLREQLLPSCKTIRRRLKKTAVPHLKMKRTETEEKSPDVPRKSDHLKRKLVPEAIECLPDSSSPVMVVKVSENPSRSQTKKTKPPNFKALMPINDEWTMEEDSVHPVTKSVSSVEANAFAEPTSSSDSVTRVSSPWVKVEEEFVIKTEEPDDQLLQVVVKQEALEIIESPEDANPAESTDMIEGTSGPISSTQGHLVDSVTQTDTDSDLEFLLSILPSMRQLPRSDKSMLKAQIQQLFMWKLNKYKL